jgi:hypothetical protein
MLRPFSNSTALVLVAVPLVVMCLACVALACAWARNGRVGLWWSANVSPARAFANSRYYQAMCIAVPWRPELPTTGRPSLDLTP